jgi:small-conductance mechanosensitive channel
MSETLRQWLSNPLVSKGLIIIAGLVLLATAERLFRRWTARRIHDPENRSRLSKLFSFLGYIIGFLFVVTVLSDQLGNLTVALGVAGAGIAFALQEVIASFAGWVAITLGNFYQISDRVQLGGITGDVIDIGILRTTLMECGDWVKSDLYNGRIVRVANSFVFKEPVFNYSRDFPFLWDEITLPIKYGSDLNLARKIMQGVADEITSDEVPLARESWMVAIEKYVVDEERVDPLVTMLANDNWVEFTLRYVVDYKRRRITKDLLFKKIMEQLDNTEGAVAIASTTIHIVQTPALEVRIAS